MAKVKTTELTGAALDWTVAKVEGVSFVDMGYCDVPILYAVQAHQYSPSTRWELGGPIIERERIDTISEMNHWEGFKISNGIHLRTRSKGPTPLIAAMRCYVAFKLGDEIDIPEDLTNAG